MITLLLSCCYLISVYCEETYDYIVVGSATGGVVASRLAEQRNRVLLIEAGADDLTYSCSYNPDRGCVASPFGDFIAGTPLLPYKQFWWLFSVQDLKWNMSSMPSFWNYNKTELSGTTDLLRGKMLGGCLTHNGHTWTRGSVRDFDYVAQKYNLPDWSFKNIMPYFQKLETYFGENKTFRGDNGPIPIMTQNIQKWQYKFNAFFNQTIQSGLPFNNHQNGDYPQTGIGFMETNIGKYEHDQTGLFNSKYYRASSSTSYIRNIGLKNGYLTVWDNTTVQRVIFDNNISKYAIGVEYYDDQNNLNSVYCEEEVIISAGTYQSPQLLMLSGIGPIDELNAFNIAPILVNDNIGRYGQDHSYVWYPLQVNMSSFGDMTYKRPANGTILNTLSNTTEYFDIEGFPMIYLSSGKYDRLGLDYNDIRYDAFETGPDSFNVIVDPAIYSKNLTIKLKSLDSRIYPNVYGEYYSDSRDYDQMVEGIMALRKILFETNPNQNVFIDDPYFTNLSIEEWRDWVLENTVISIHSVGTVSMGEVVDTKCSVKGVNNLRVIDASIWPEATNSGTMSLVLMLGEKCVQHIIDDHKHDDDGYGVIIAIVGAIVIIIIIFLGLRFLIYPCYKNKSRDKHVETMPLIKAK